MKQTINEFCKLFRRETLELTLLEMSNLTGVKWQTLSSFENGRSKNISHIDNYLSCSNNTQKKLFIRGMANVYGIKL